MKIRTVTKNCNLQLSQSRRASIGHHVGKPSIVTKKNCEFLCQLEIWADRANEGLIPTELHDHLKNSSQKSPQSKQRVLLARLSRLSTLATSNRKLRRLTRQLHVTVSVLQPKNIVSTHFENIPQFLQEKNTRVSCKTGKSFGEFIEHFIIGGE